MPFQKGYIPWNKGVPQTEETKQKISKAGMGHRAPNKGKTGIFSEETRKKWSEQRRGSNHPQWKGDKTKYRGIHEYLTRNLGEASYCSFNKTHKAKVYHWANISGTYQRDVSDYMSLCVKCHSQYDRNRKEQIVI